MFNGSRCQSLFAHPAKISKQSDADFAIEKTSAVLIRHSYITFEEMKAMGHVSVALGGVCQVFISGVLGAQFWTTPQVRGIHQCFAGII